MVVCVTEVAKVAMKICTYWVTLIVKLWIHGPTGSKEEYTSVEWIMVRKTWLGDCQSLVSLPILSLSVCKGCVMQSRGNHEETSKQ